MNLADLQRPTKSRGAELEIPRFSHAKKQWRYFIEKGVLCGIVAGAALGVSESVCLGLGSHENTAFSPLFVYFLLNIAVGAFLGGISGLALALTGRSQRPGYEIACPFYTAFFTSTLLLLFCCARGSMHPVPAALFALIGVEEFTSLLLPGYLLLATVFGCVVFFLLTRERNKATVRTYTAEVTVFCALLVGIPHFVSWPRVSVIPIIVFMSGSFLILFLIRRLLVNVVSTGTVGFDWAVRWKVVAFFVMAAVVISLGAFALGEAKQPIQREIFPSKIGGARNDNPFDVILIVLDTVRADHVGVYGYQRETTPSVDALAQDGVTFDFALSTSSWTLPSHASLFTGMFPSAHGAHSTPESAAFVAGLGAGSTTLAEILERYGYVTGCISANFGVVSGYFGLDQGFEYFDSRPRFIGAAMSHAFHQRYLTRYAPRWFGYLTKRFRLAEDITDEALQWIDKHGESPYFLFLNYMDAHSPYLPPPPYDGLFGEATDPGLLERLMLPVLRMERDVTEAERASVIGAYDGEIAYLDCQLGRLLRNLKERGAYERTMIVVTSDHGEYFGEHSLLEHGKGLYQEMLWIPLVVKYPHSERVGRDDGTVQILDIMPTILDTLGVPIPENVQGDVLGMVGHEIIAEHWARREYVMSFGRRFDENLKAIFEDGMKKYICSSNKRDELYDLHNDPKETRNVISLHSGLREELKVRLASWEASTADLARAALPVELDEELLERMKALGYVGH